ncbi:MAG: BtrH N-terminal domain-containing protein [Thiovulaceae bacterium]|nr:BtrH N-terminal domain-containing protein [Sulfurimonadaceae bacterium]
MSANNFEHTHSAHCESGVMSSMLRHYGINLSEAMVFGLSGALTFAYLPFVKIGGMPLVAYRSLPKSIIKKIQKNLGVKMKLETFSSKEKGQDRLDELLKEGKVVGAQTSVFWLPYFPEDMRFHFNAHNLVIYSKEGDNYNISDPVFETTQVCDKASLTKARFTKGLMAPKGLLYYPIEMPKELDLKPVLKKNIKKTAKAMLKTPVAISGLKGIKSLAKSILKLKAKDKRYAKLYLGHIVRMQEEIGTGGAGFRYLYASFLQEASEVLDGNDVLKEASKLMLEVGDKWREFALMIAKSIKSKKEIDYKAISDKLLEIADDEAIVYKKMLELK